jgi:hypothetical protein
MTRWPVLLLLILLLSASTVTAQDSTVVRVPTPAATEDCPTDLVCVEYEGAVIEVDPACGPVVAVVTSESLARTTDLTGITESYGVHGVVLIADGDGYEVSGEFSGPAVGPLAPARFGSVGCLVFTEAT